MSSQQRGCRGRPPKRGVFRGRSATQIRHENQNILLPEPHPESKPSRPTRGRGRPAGRSTTATTEVAVSETVPKGEPRGRGGRPAKGRGRPRGGIEGRAARERQRAYQRERRARLSLFALGRGESSIIEVEHSYATTKEPVDQNQESIKNESQENKSIIDALQDQRQQDKSIKENIALPLTIN